MPELPQACSPLTGGSLFQHRLSGVLEPRTRFTLSGRQSFSLNLSGELRSAERGDSPRPAAGQEGRHQGFYPLNSHFLLGESGADCQHVTAAKRGTAEDFFYRRGAQCAPMSRHIRSVRYRTATQTVSSTQARHDSAAQLFNALYRTAPADLGVWSIYLRRCCLLQRANELRNTGMLRLR